MSNKPGGQMRAGGSILAGSIVLGTLIGVFLGQASIGVLAGTAFGLVIVAAIWLKDRTS